MSKIFKQNQDFSKKPGRNNFDLSYDNNFTTGFGRILPLMCKEVNPGETFRISSDIGLRALPLAYPIQTPVRVQVSFFYQRLRNLQTNWMDFYSQTKDIEIPYISLPSSQAHRISTGTLADYLGVPTTYADESGEDFYPIQLRIKSGISSQYSGDFTIVTNNTDTGSSSDGSVTYGSGTNGVTTSPLAVNLISQNPNSYLNQPILSALSLNGFHYIRTNATDANLNGKFRIYTSDQGSQTFSLIFSEENPDNPNDYASSIIRYYCGLVCSYEQNDGYYFGELPAVTLEDLKNHLITGSKYYISIAVDGDAFDLAAEYNPSQVLVVGRSYVNSTDVSPLNNPFVIAPGDSEPDIKLAAYPFRCYESIYNAYYRNSNGVDPFLLNGVEEYNRYCTNLGDGADSTTPLEIKSRNYELDAFTSCYKSPQLGEAALVGVSATGVFTFEDEQGHTFKVTPQIGDDGNTLTGIDSYDENTPIGSLTRLRDLISYGISINDFRNVSHFQNFMENALRRGLRYAEVLKSHSGVDTQYKSAELPVYIGGYSRNLNVQQINSTAQTEEMQLGDYRGQAGLFTSSQHTITHYCDEPGFIMCLMTITPIPCYSQMLDTKFIKDNLLSWHFPEFNGIGLQPIDYRVVTPIQCKVSGKSYSDTFGYQRPWWDLIASYDEVHGKFRTDLQGFLITRNFTNPPELNANFLHINPDEMTNPFIEENDKDHTFMGQIHFDIKVKRPIPRIHIPTLS